jgi:hypothetical protein
MNEPAAGNGSKQQSAPDNTKAASARRHPWWRVVLRVVVASILGFVAIVTVHEMTYVPKSADGLYEWTLRWPGAQPGAKFKTEAGDDIRRLLGTLLADTGADWQVPLTETGAIDIELSHPAYPSLWAILKWRIWKTAPLKQPERVLLTVRVRKVDRRPVRFDVARIGRDGQEAAAESYREFPAARDAALDELARAMEEYQT